MKRAFLGSLITTILVLLTLTSCEEVKKAFYETFNSEEKQPESKEARDRAREEKRAEEERAELVERTANEALEGIEEALSGMDPALSQYIKGDVRTSLNREGEIMPPIFYDPQRLREAQESLYSFMGTDELYIYSTYIYFERHRIRLSLLNPNNPSEVDDYYYRTETEEWTKEDPVRLSVKDLDSMEEEISPIKEVDFGMAHKLFLEVLSRAGGLDGVEPLTVIYYRHKWGQWGASINSERVDYSIQMNDNGDVKFEQK